MMYDSMINTHYRFLGCLEYDRIGEYQGDDHMSLRSLGQLDLMIATSYVILLTTVGGLMFWEGLRALLRVVRERAR